MEKPVKGWPGYFISTEGKLRSTRLNSGRLKEPGKILKTHEKDGYWFVTLCNHGVLSHKGVHQLVLEAFIGLCPPGQQARHLNGDRKDNRLKNLRWGTPKVNRSDMWRHGTMPHGESLHSAKLTEEKVLDIRHTYMSKKFTIDQIAQKYKVDSRTIRSVIRGEWWKHVGGPIVSGNLRPIGTAHHKAVLNKNLVKKIRKLNKSGLRPVEISRRLRISYPAVQGVLNGVTWRHVK